MRRTTAAGNEIWSSRDLARVLGDSDYRNFEQVVQTARRTCFNSALRVEDQFVDVTEMVDIGGGAQRSLKSIDVDGSYGQKQFRVTLEISSGRIPLPEDERADRLLMDEATSVCRGRSRTQCGSGDAVWKAAQ